MMTFKQYLTEQEADSFARLIETNCRQFLEESQRNGLLLRGVKGLEDAEPSTVLDAEGEEMEYAVKAVRQDRRPLDITVQRSKMLDNWFDEKFGIRARSQCVFATGGKTPAIDLGHYGTPCVIFPIGKIEYVWSAKVEDLYTDLDLYTDVTSPVKDDAELEERIRKWLEGKSYRTTGLDEAVTMKHEIMIKCSSYYAFPMEYMPQIKRALGMR